MKLTYRAYLTRNIIVELKTIDIFLFSTQDSTFLNEISLQGAGLYLLVKLLHVFPNMAQ